MAVTTEQILLTRDRLQREATLLAGELANLTQRATTYHHLYQDSGGQHLFPLIAAHGALWARGYFHFGLKLGELLSWQYFNDSATRRRQIESMHTFADAFREINRVVCVETFTNYHLVKEFGEIPELIECISPEILSALGRVHWARDQGIDLTNQEKRAIYRSHFLDEQERVVGPRIEAAMATMNWPLLEKIALRPWVDFAYFPRYRAFWFRDFSNKVERIQRGMCAFDLGAKLGWENVAAKLADYDCLPQQFFTDPVAHFAAIRTTVLPLVRS